MVLTKFCWYSSKSAKLSRAQNSWWMFKKQSQVLFFLETKLKEIYESSEESSEIRSETQIMPEIQKWPETQKLPEILKLPKAIKYHKT